MCSLDQPHLLAIKSSNGLSKCKYLQTVHSWTLLWLYNVIYFLGKRIGTVNITL